jgi:MFS family permease
MNAANVVGAMIIGFMIDRYHVTTAINFCAIGTVVAVFLFWTFAVYKPMLFLFAIVYGIFAGGFASTWSGVVDPVRRKYPATETGMIISFFAAGKGVASIISGPLSGALVRSDGWKHHASFAFGSGYGTLILFSGLTASLSLIGWCGKRCGFV